MMERYCKEDSELFANEGRAELWLQGDGGSAWHRAP